MHEDRMVPASDLVLMKDIAERTGMNPTTLLNAASARRTRSGFPCPIAGQGSRGIWLWSEVETWWHEVYTKPIDNVKPHTVRQRHRPAA